MFDVVVIGGGHAGTEAAAAAFRVGAKVALVTMDKSALARLSCNPAIGGTAKGQLVKEIDALGGLMGVAADRTAIQYRMLNKSKGPAVWSPRAQVDRDYYSIVFNELFEERYAGIEIIEDEAIGLVVEGGILTGVECSGRFGTISTKTAIVCSGTFLRGLTHCGNEKEEAGRFGESASNHLSESLRKNGFELVRFKTGTPPRVLGKSIDFSEMEKQGSDEDTWFFSHETTHRHLDQLPCYRSHTSPLVHDKIRARISEAPMFNGSIDSTGPRYCPSIEDKVMRFPERERHPLVFEPEGVNHPWYYVNGFSTSLPHDLQLEGLRTVPGCENVVIERSGYAIEYDVVPPHSIKTTLETKAVKGLYLAGQINGTSGYEEAGVQGLLAGANAALKVQGKESILLRRDEAYAGVLLDDLVTLHPEEPYRMFTSRAEHRLLLRQDNAEERLYEKAFRAGLINEDRYTSIRSFVEKKNALVHRLHSYRVARKTVLSDTQNPDKVEPISNILQRPGITLLGLNKTLGNGLLGEVENDFPVISAAEIEVRYEGYLARERRLIERMSEQENKRIPDNFSYDEVTALSAEGKIRLELHKPTTLGQASRIAGVTPSDMAILLVTLKRRESKKA